MERLTAVILILTVTLNLAGCGIQNMNEPEPEAGSGPEYVIPGSDKELLPLQYMPVFYDELEPEPPEFEDISLECPDLPEIRQTRYGTDMGLEAFADFIADRFGIYVDGKWNVFAHYYDEEQTAGMAEFMYTIGEIDTNRAVIFWLENGKAVRIGYKNMDCVTDEGALLERVMAFNARYEQERPSLGEDEHLEVEKIFYTYYYNTDKLVYSYNVFFSYGEFGVINNDWGTQCYIDEEGKAVFFRMESAQDA